MDAVVDHALDSDTDLVLGGSALRQLYDARRRNPGTDDISVFEDEAWYKKIQDYLWYVKGIVCHDSVVHPTIRIYKQQENAITITMYYEVTTRVVEHRNCTYPTRATTKTSGTHTWRQPYAWWLTGTWWLQW